MKIENGRALVANAHDVKQKEKKMSEGYLPEQTLQVRGITCGQCFRMF